MPRPTWELPPLNVGGYSSRLPDPGSLLGAAPIPGTSGVPPEWAQRAIEASTVLSGHFLQGVALEVGWPSDLAPLDELTGLALDVVAAAGSGDPLAIAQAVADLVRESAVLRAVLEEPLERVQEVVAEALAGLAGATAAQVGELVPVVGWVVALIRNTVSMARTVKANDAAGFGILPGALEGLTPGVVPSFNRARDDDATNALLAVLRGEDWTEVWLPSTAPWSALALDFDGNDKIDGWYMGAGISGQLATNVGMPGGAWSAIPGLAQMGGAFYGRTDGKGGTRSISDVYPSVNQLAGLAWTYLQRPSAYMGAVDFKAVTHAWGTWQGKGRELHESTFLSGDGPRIRAARDMLAGALGWAYSEGKLVRTDLYGPKRVARHVRDLVRSAVDDMRKRLWRNMGTIAVAYMPPSAPALQSDAELKLRYAAMRHKLLSHRARWKVELDLVPDKAYRDMLWDSRQKLAAPAVPASDRIDDGPQGQAPRLPGAPTGGANGSANGGGGLVVAFVAAAALAAMFWRRVR